MDENGQRRWQGPRNRTEKRGPALVRYTFDVPVNILGCLLPDGTRGWIGRMLPTKERQDGEWYRHLADSSVQVGDIELSEKDVRFIDDAGRTPRHLWPLRRDGRRAAPSKYVEGGLLWDGPRQSLESHGPAVIEFITDRADVVMNCLFPKRLAGYRSLRLPVHQPVRRLVAPRDV